MMKRNNAVVFLGAWVDACALWRMYFPHLNIPGSSFFCFNQAPDFKLIAGNDIGVVQRCCVQAQFDFITTLKRLGMKVIYELDDNVWELPDENPAKYVLTQHAAGFEACIRRCDVLSVSTKELAKAIKRHVKDLRSTVTNKLIPIFINENRIDERVFAAPVKREPLIVGWAGSSSHIGDLRIIETPLKEIMAEYPDLHVQFRGCNPPESLQGAVDFRLWSPVAEYPSRMPMWGWSIAMAPVTDHIFNESKSPIKMIEAAYCRIPCLASWVAPYDRFCSHDPELRWLLCSGTGNWASKLRELINDPARRDYLAARAYAVVQQYYSYDRPHEGWAKTLEATYAV